MIPCADEQMRLGAHLVGERVAQPDPAKPGARAGLGQRLGGGAPQAADDRVLLDRQDRAGPRGGAGQRRGVERLDRAEVKDRGVDAVALQARRGAEHLPQDRAGAGQHDVPALGERHRGADRERRVAEQVRLAVLAEPQYTGPSSASAASVARRASPGSPGASTVIPGSARITAMSSVP